MPVSKVFLLDCSVQNYAWGKLGSSSEVASLVKSVRPDFTIDETKNYAELWMGTHPSGPSSVLSPDGQTGPTLQSYLQEHPDLVGNKIRQTFGSTDLPFLMKVLSVRTALSIQAHPDKILAEQLYKSKPDLYKDPNHKPELALALTPFDALCGFRPFPEICKFLSEIPEFAALIGQDQANLMLAARTPDEQTNALKIGFAAAMKASKENVKQHLSQLVERLTQLENANSLATLLLRIHQDFPGDIGCFGIYFLNYLQLKPGEALYLGANEPHAYLSGDCVEIMACSDNVVRAGLTPKLIDVNTLCSMLTYRCSSAASQLFAGTVIDPQVIVYDPPVPDFALAKIQVPAGKISGYKVLPLDGASILILISGAALLSCSGIHLQVQRGSVLFVAAGEELTLEAIPATANTTQEDLLMFRGYC